MKKILLLVLVLFSGFLLASCNNKKEVEVTHKEAQQMLAKVDGQQTINETFSIKGKIDLTMESTETDSQGRKSGQEMKITGSIDAYGDVSSYENHYIYSHVVLKMNTKMYTSGSEAVSEVMDINMKLYMTKGNMYADSVNKVAGTTTTSKVKSLNQFTKEDYNNLVEVFKPNAEVEGSKNGLDIIQADTEFNMYEVGGKHQLVIELSEAQLSGMFGLFGQFMDITVNKGNSIKLTVTFGERFESASVVAKLDITMKSKIEFSPDESTESKIKGSLSLDIKTKVSKPRGLPSQETLDSWEEGDPITFPGMS